MIFNIDVKSWHGKTIRSRFEEKIKKDKNTNCHLRIGKSLVLAHRLSYIIHKGDIPQNMCVLHICDTPLCVNPDHLFLGTQQDNIKDRDMKNHTRNRYTIKQLGAVSALEGGK
jgi:hypothetical protein